MPKMTMASSDTATLSISISITEDSSPLKNILKNSLTLSHNMLKLY